MGDRSTLRPVFVCLSHVGIGLHLCQYLICDRAYHGRVRTHNAESNRPGRIRTKDKPDCANPCLRSETCRNLLPKTKHELISLLRVRRQDNHLGEVRIWQFWIVGKPETRRATAYIGTNDLCLRLCPQPRLDFDYGG